MTTKRKGKPAKAPKKTKAASKTKAQSTRGRSQQHLIAPHAHLLGTMPDTVLAKQLKVSMWSLRAARLAAGIPTFRPGSVPPQAAPSLTDGRKNKASPAIVKVAAHHDLVGKVADYIVAERAGVSIGTVRNYRREHSISAAPRAEASTPTEALPPEPSAPKARTKPSAKRSGRKPSPLEPYTHLLGTTTDREIAEIVGVSVGSVYQYRRNRGIPSYRATTRAGAGAAKSTTKSPAKPKAKSTTKPAPVAKSVPSAKAAPAAKSAPTPAPMPAATPRTAKGQWAFRVVFDGHEQARIAVGATLIDAAEQMDASGLGTVKTIERLGPVL